jgi:hypothetical protein
MMIAIYIKKSVPRLQYTVNLIFQTVLKVDYILINNQQTFIQTDLPKISYCEQPISDEVHFHSTALLFENTITSQQIDLQRSDDFPTFFPHNKNTILSYDAFAMIFYLVSRYEEYTETQQDKHGRFRADLGLAYQNNFLKIPLVNQLCSKIQNLIEAKYPKYIFPKQSFTFLPTYDIDYAWAYKNRSFKRTIGGYARTILTGNFSTLSARLQVQFGFKNDPFYVFDFLDDLHKKYQLSPIYFFLLGDYSQFDKNIPPHNSAFRKLITRLSERYKTGLHPSYLSNSDFNQLIKEKKRLDEITKKNTIRSRQHFLKLETPKTYQNLIKAGIKEDYTMGYATEIGFRASIATPYFWYDLKNEKATNLLITPFQVMDVTLKNYLKLSPEKALEEIQTLIQNTKAVNGTFSTLWHNSSFDDKEWKGWREMYLEMIRIKY